MGGPCRAAIHYSGCHTYCTHSWLLGYFYLADVFTLRFTATIQIYGTLEGVPTTLAPAQLLVTF
jgi:hypothetical protein